MRKWGYEVKGAGGRAEIIVCADNFPRPDARIVSFSTDPEAQGGYRPFLPGFRVILFGDAGRAGGGDHPQDGRVRSSRSGGEGGRDHPAGRIARASFGTAHGVTLIPTRSRPPGRTGTLLYEEHEGIEADVTGRKASAGFSGSPIPCWGAEAGQHGSTFGGNPLAARWRGRR